MEDIIIRKKDEGSNTWNVEQGDKKSVECGWDEMMGLLAALTMPNDRGCLRWMEPKVKKYIPEDGEFVVSGWNEYGMEAQWVAIVQEGLGNSDKHYCSYAFYVNKKPSDKTVSELGIGLYCDGMQYTRPASEEEKNLLLSKLHEIGKDWNAEKKAVVDWIWEPKVGKTYYFPYFSYSVNRFLGMEEPWENSTYDNCRRSRGWVFRTKEECQAMCDKLNESIKNVK